MCLNQSNLYFLSDIPTVVSVDPKYLNWSTSSSTCPFIFMLVTQFGGWSWDNALEENILLFSKPVSILYAADVCLSQNCRSTQKNQYHHRTAGCRRSSCDGHWSVKFKQSLLHDILQQKHTYQYINWNRYRPSWSTSRWFRQYSSPEIVSPSVSNGISFPWHLIPDRSVMCFTVVLFSFSPVGSMLRHVV